MKRIIITLCLVLLISFSFVSCGEEMDLLSGNTDISYKIENGEAIVTKVPNKTAVRNIEIPDDYDGVPVTKIADFAAVNLEYAVKVTIGKNVREISDWSFGNSRKIIEFDVDENNPYICDVDGVLYTKDMKTLLFYPPAACIQTEADEEGNEVKFIKYTIPEGVETIRSKAFYKCYELTEITLPSTLKSIEEMAFFRCSLGELTLPEGLNFIGKDAFSYCTAIEELTVPATVTQIDEYAFYNCTALKNLTMLGKEADMILGKKWFPTDNGRDLGGLELKWTE